LNQTGDLAKLKSVAYRDSPKLASLKNPKSGTSSTLHLVQTGEDSGSKNAGLPSKEWHISILEADMVPTIKMINEYRPRIEQGITVQKPELVRALSRSTGLVEGTIDQTIK
jgi:hypothetical protein